MKKLFTLIALALTAATSWAEAPELLFGNTPVEPGKVYETGYIAEKDIIPGLPAVRYLQESNLYLKGLLGEEVTVIVTASDPVQVCSINGQCIVGTEVTKKGSMGEVEADIVAEVDDYVTVDLRIHNEYLDMTNADPATILPNITLNVKAYYDLNPDEYTEAKVILTNKSEEEIGGGVSDVKVNSAISLGSANILNYNVNAPTKLNIYSVSGALVISRIISNVGSVSLDALQPGVYIYSAAGNTGKILVK